MKSRTLAILPALVAPILLSPVAAARADRPVMHAIHVPDNIIQVDGYEDDWNRLGVTLKQCELSAQGESHLFVQRPELGAVTGPDDLSMTAAVAYDTNYLYILADVHDNVLINSGDPTEPWVGDDFEVYVDANDPGGRYADSINENDGHWIFVPRNFNLRYPDGFAYSSSGRVDGVSFASRLRPFGYTIECAIPKSLLPNWQRHPDMKSVGFDIQVSDDDTPGLIGHDAGPKAALYLLSPDYHFRTSKLLGELDFDVEAKPLLPDVFEKPRADIDLARSLGRNREADADRNADDLLARIDDQNIGALLQIATRSKNVKILRAAALIYARRPLLPIPDGAFNDLWPSLPTGADPDDSYYPYALLALAQRRELTVTPALYNAYLSLPDPALRNTFIWCLGRNGDPKAIPMLARDYGNTTGIEQMTLAWSLAMLGDKTGVPTLVVAAKGEPATSAWGNDARRLLAQLNVSY